MNLVEYIKKQKRFGLKTFGPGVGTSDFDAGLIDHIESELTEIKESPGDLEEWIDVIILALEGCWRNGHNPKQIVECLEYKQQKNIHRKWPDWKTAEPGKAIFHIKE